MTDPSLRRFPVTALRHRSPQDARRHPGGQSGKATPWVLGTLALALAGGGAAWWSRQGDAPASPAATAAVSAPGASGPASGPRGPGRPGGPGGPGGFGARVQPVSVSPVRQKDIRVTLQAIGTIAASNTAVVRTKIEGELRSIRFREGQTVRAGDLLAELDNRAQQITLSQVEGQLARDQAQLQNARIDLARFKDLLGQDGVSKQQVDTQEALVRQLQGTVQSDQAIVDNARLQLSYTRIVAPIGGRVGLRQADLGNVVRPSDTNGLLSISQTSPANVVFAVPDQHLPHILEALRAQRTLAVEAWDRDQRQRLAVGQVASTDNAIDAATSTIKLKAAFPNADGRLFPNQFVNVRLQLSTVANALAVPAAAVLRNAEGHFVYLVKDDSTVTVRPVKAGATEAEWVSVEGDLQPGDKVVTDGVDRLREGSRVELIRPQNGTSGGPGGGRRSEARAGGERAGAASAPASGQAGGPASARPARGEGTRNADAPRPPSAEATSPAGAASGGGPGGGRAAEFLSRLPPEVADKVRAMSPEERRAWFQQQRAQREAAGNGGR